jgi:hypothetical protein
MGKLSTTLFALLLLTRQICNGCCTRTRASAYHKISLSGLFSGFETTFVANAALVAAMQICHPDYFVHPPKFVPRHSYSLQSLYLDGKKCAIPSLHRNSFSAKVSGLCPVLASGNTTSPYCRAVRANSGVSEPYRYRASSLRHAAGFLPSRLDLEY